jgi:hypothetical protein
MPWWIKAVQLLIAASAAFSLGLYTRKFSGGPWNSSDLAGLIGCCTAFVVTTALLIYGFWKYQ